MKRTVVLNVAGLSRSLLGVDTPRLNELLSSSVCVKPLCPAVTCTMQATYLTGKLPVEHGIVGNGWYFRDLAEVMFWRQSNRLIQAEKIWHAGRRRNSSFTCANSFWWYNMATDADWSVAPRPIYCADGRKIPDCYTSPPHLRGHLTESLGQFPLFRFWGPATTIESSRWIAKAAQSLEEQFQPTLHLVYLPHLDYILQKQGPHGAIQQDLQEIDSLCGTLIDYFRSRGCRIVILSEYGITAVDRPIHPNRLLRDAGFLKVKVDLGREYLDPGASRAFAVADHQVAHVYVQDPGDIEEVKSVFSGVAGIERVLDSRSRQEAGLDHERAGGLALVADNHSWFTYYFWDDDRKAPDYARTVNIHAKPGYDPCELFFDPKIPFPALTVWMSLVKKYLGFRTLLQVVPLDASLIRGSHGRIPENREEWPLLLSSEPCLLLEDPVEAPAVFNLLLNHIFH
ncbi:MAG: alkaline phosphatase family protein [Geobacter sp.]|nr:MAG: alkaline phosphatase family protein [Geobacter sp.]